MAKDGSLKSRIIKQRHFAARELQFSIALIVVLALLAGIFLQTVSSALISYYGMDTPALGVLLILGYVFIVILLAVFFTHRLVGPFKRLEYEMKLIVAGNRLNKLSVRNQDDLHIKNFINYLNSFLSRFDDMSVEYSRLNSTVLASLEGMVRELEKEKADCPMIREEISVLVKKVHEFREKW
ncbi:MAG TPA: hypothetical protein DDW94_09945 [Deltaproteobacteria bacterium]|nr:MAG: hypothetical protein A2Z79_12540 [Deltaproteobacteria bacterium GWA2_55_82]OIJ73429.1 MAG: hypothetical protein A2V21_303610 [Deltaproteobacteria bacterium GWC2_55_46]HBG47292.1 hypothetical protein [Deltaproteobacteria bacterium]HCY10058.1 hypothetical protein [Deltaproteobacteria bacterium]